MCDTNEGASGSSMPADSDGGVENYDQNLARHPFGDYNCLKSLEGVHDIEVEIKPLGGPPSSSRTDR